MWQSGAASEERGGWTDERPGRPLPCGRAVQRPRDEDVGPVSDTPVGRDEKTFEQLLDELEAMTRRMAAGDIGIEAAAALYEQAGELHAQATERLARVQERIERLAGDEGGADA
jgi:exodeoxyribonuclease VII small subunit